MLELIEFFQIDWLDTWKEMEKLYKANPDKLKAIGTHCLNVTKSYAYTRDLPGVSNFSVEFLERLLAVATVVPAVNQIELHPYVPLI